jgi:uncharacterized protein YqfA (UPF0365 family)
MLEQIWTILLIVAAVVVLIFVGLFLSFINIWLRAWLADAPVAFFGLIGMTLRRVPPKPDRGCPRSVW